MKCSTELCLRPFVPEENSDESEMLDRIVPGAICVCKENSDENEVLDRIVPEAICV
jgi:hypothetical protein